MRKLLDRFYLLMLGVAAACLAVIFALVIAQVIGRIFDSTLVIFNYPPYGFLIPSLAEISGYLFAAASFLALAATLKRGAHIRVTMLVGSVQPRMRKIFELWALAACLAIAAYATWSLVALAYSSFKFGDVSSGLFPIKYWIPQSAMALGLAAFCIALLDELVLTWRRGRPSFVEAESAITMGQE
ncbi:MAG: TRAP transporter small permease subunit [Xanthobacteraceae bacterium]|nr:TRAP transporter small permease subunit [Xanthobacteraceae bacterium]QYK45481.1 MAG: TRAP transporter small permease subunit [Xanthobacteraceae bacterium]HMN50659.1 TRAP transporter small permease [Xanthobacteraceae bacterium]